MGAYTCSLEGKIGIGYWVNDWSMILDHIRTAIRIQLFILTSNVQWEIRGAEVPKTKGVLGGPYDRAENLEVYVFECERLPVHGNWKLSYRKCVPARAVSCIYLRPATDIYGLGLLLLRLSPKTHLK